MTEPIVFVSATRAAAGSLPGGFSLPTHSVANGAAAFPAAERL